MRVRVRRWSSAVVGILVLAIVLPPAVLLATGSAASAARSSALALVWGGYASAVLLGSGGWAAQRRSGSALLWLQKPVSPVLLHLHGLPPRLLVTSLAIMALTGASTGAAAVLEGPSAVGDMWTAGCTMAVTGVVLVCMIQGVSGLGVPREELAALVGFMGLTFLEWKSFDTPDVFGPLLPLAQAVGVPVDGIGYTGRLLGGGLVDDPAGHLLSVALYALGWVVVGALGVVLTSRPRFAGRED
jgi:hypothetical protein